jgi:hypothetical protein
MNGGVDRSRGEAEVTRFRWSREVSRAEPRDFADTAATLRYYTGFCLWGLTI